MTATWYLLPALGADCQLRETSGFRARQALWTKWSYPDIYGSLYAYTFLTRPHIYIISLSFQFWVASNNGFLTSFSTEREERKVKATFPTLLLLCSTAKDASEHSLVVTRPPALRLLSCHRGLRSGGGRLFPETSPSGLLSSPSHCHVSHWTHP